MHGQTDDEDEGDDGAVLTWAGEIRRATMEAAAGWRSWVEACGVELGWIHGSGAVGQTLDSY